VADYTYTGAYPRALFGLAQDVNAWHHPADGDPSELAAGQTIVVEPGDGLTTTDPYPHPDLAETPPTKPATKAAATKTKEESQK
jgi:hypothetical protein